jgi:hypothetical protein
MQICPAQHEEQDPGDDLAGHITRFVYRTPTGRGLRRCKRDAIGLGAPLLASSAPAAPLIGKPCSSLLRVLQ